MGLVPTKGEIMISLRFVLIIISLMLTILLYVLLGINDFKLQMKQIFALIPLLLILLTINRMDTYKPIVKADIRDVPKQIIQTEIAAEKVIEVAKVEQKKIQIIRKEILKTPTTVDKPIITEEKVKLKDEKIHSFKFINPIHVIILGLSLPSTSLKLLLN